MSCFIVSNNHINLISIAELAQFSYDGKTVEYYPTSEEVLELSKKLLTENVNSWNFRYPDHTENSEDCHGSLELLSNGDIRKLIKKYPPLAIISQIHCFEYQSCEHDEWESSDVKKLCGKLVNRLVRYIEGYNDVQWGID